MNKYERLSSSHVFPLLGVAQASGTSMVAVRELSGWSHTGGLRCRCPGSKSRALDEFMVKVCNLRKVKILDVFFSFIRVFCYSLLLATSLFKVCVGVCETSSAIGCLGA